MPSHAHTARLPSAPHVHVTCLCYQVPSLGVSPSLRPHLLSLSLASPPRETANANAAKTSAATAVLIDMAPAAVKKLQEKSGDCMKLTMPEMSALAFKYFKGTVLKGNKPQYAKTLADLIKAQPLVLQVAATHALAGLPTAAGRAGRKESASLDEESVSSDEESASSDEESASNSDPSDLDEEERAQMRALRETGSA
jgi:hypothetical protein|eukprot:4528054-Prymnesium_polylepis.1